MPSSSVMPITYDVNHSAGYVRVTWAGDVDGRIFAAHLQKLLTDPDAMRYRRSLGDIRAANLTISGFELGSGLRREAAPRLETHPWKSAILVNADSAVQYGFARQFEGYGEGVVRCKIFHDEATALAWLQEEP